MKNKSPKILGLLFFFVYLNSVLGKIIYRYTRLNKSLFINAVL